MSERAAGHTLMCYVDGFEDGVVRGWAHDPGKSEPAILHVLLDGVELGRVKCADVREDVSNLTGLSPFVGYAFQLPDGHLDGASHRLEFRSTRRDPVPIIHDGQMLPSLEFSASRRPEVFSFVDGLDLGTVKGWVVRRDRPGADLKGGCDLLVTCGGVRVCQLKANRYRADVARALSCDPNCGFQFTPPPNFRKPFAQEFAFFLLPEMIELDGSPLSASFIQDDTEVKLLEMVGMVDQLHVDVTRLRRQLLKIIPAPQFNVADYDSWARVYFDKLRRRVARDREQGDRDGPLVSVICPTYRPRLADFTAAVESVFAQSYRNWELIIVDDGSRMPELTAQIEAFAKRDKRVRVARRARNGGISEATNTALASAKGEYVAFFDHDDLMLDVALEVMMVAARRTGAAMLYSDEDKIDDSGFFSEPAFKPDWNHRLMLGVNYVCHLLMVRGDVLARVGGPDKRYDGAQDHDLILRISEAIKPGDIHHVDEVLYHWRRTPGSTASDISAKSYAIDAGIKAVSDHLTRIGRPARVSNMLDITLYEVEWLTSQTPKVTIIIPYKDEIETTRTCVETLLAKTDYPAWEIVLVDNWSITSEALRFRKWAGKQKGVRVKLVEEEFNFSRLNNLAAAESDAEFLVFMNNDLFVREEGWLRTLLAEALVDPSVGAVGGKYLYPNGTIQHGGVVVGIGGVAGHVHTGLAADDGGYGGRAHFAQELSAVTAACVLVRNEAFRRVGGFDEVELKVAFNDIDLCLKLRASGYKIMWTPAFVADHHESLSRGSDDRPEREARFFHETEAMKERWGDVLKRDPFYNKHFTLERQPFFDLNAPET